MVSRRLPESLRPLLSEGFKRESGGFVAAGRLRALVSEELALRLVASGIASLSGDRLLPNDPARPPPAPRADEPAPAGPPSS